MNFTLVDGFFITVIIVILLYVFSDKISLPNGVGGSRLPENWYKHDAFVLIVCGLFFYFVLSYLGEGIWPGWIWTQTMSWWTVIIIIGLILFGVMKKENKQKPLKHTVAKWVLALVIVIIIVKFIGYPVYTSMADKSPDQRRSAVTMMSAANQTDFLPPDLETKKEIEYIINNDDRVKPEDKQLLIDIIGCESGYRQYELDGVTPYHVRGSRLNVVGIGQIHKDAWQKELEELGPEYNPDTKAGNIKMILYIYEKRGLSPWECYEKMAREFVVFAPAKPDWKRIEINVHTFMEPKLPDLTILVRGADGKPPQEFKKGGVLHMGATPYLEVQSTGEPVEMQVSRK